MTSQNAARIEAAAKAEYEHWDFSEDAPWEEADPEQQKWHRESAADMLAAVDEFEAREPLASRLAEASTQLVAEVEHMWDGRGFDKRWLDAAVEETKSALAEFVQRARQVA